MQKKKAKKERKQLTNKETEQKEKQTFNDIRESVISTKDIENAERVTISRQIDGLNRIKQKVQRKPKETIARFDRKTFDPGFMQMHTSEFTYQLLEEELQKANLISNLVAEVNAGKEASIYIAHLHGVPIIVKAFRHQRTCHNRTQGNPQTRAAAIAAKEYYRLIRAFNVGLNVPTPAVQINNVIIMQFIGSDWKPALQLKDCLLEQPASILDQIIEQIKIMYQKAQLIHGDLSEYNLLIHNNEPIIIDFPQAIDISLRENRFPKQKKRNLLVLQKDLRTIANFFEKNWLLTFNFQEVYQFIIGDEKKSEGLDAIIEEKENIQLQY
jgi:RIO kinase 1